MSAPRPWILVVPHSDDETLAAGVTIAEHAAAGRDVHVLLLTRGTASGVRGMLNGTSPSGWWGVLHDPEIEGYEPLTADEFGAARRAELDAALGCLGVTADRVHEAGLIDGQVTVAGARAAIADLVAEIGHPGPGVYAPSWLVDDNPDHRAAGQALKDLAALDPTTYADRRYYVLPAYWQDARLGQVTEFWDNPSSTEIATRARNACRAYGAWAPPARYAIGYHSVPSMFAKVDATPKALLHS